MPEDCIFCKIVKGEIPSTKLFENEKALAFLDIAPAAPGHSLVIPKAHAETLLDIPWCGFKSSIKLINGLKKFAFIIPFAWIVDPQ